MQNYAVAYREEVSRLLVGQSTTEVSYYGAVQNLLRGILGAARLPDDVRMGTSERKAGFPDLAVYEPDAQTIILPVEVKLPDRDIQDLALSTERNNQVGRYLALNSVLLICNVWQMAIVRVKDGLPSQDALKPENRVVEHVCSMWASASDCEAGKPFAAKAVENLLQLLEHTLCTYVTFHSPQTVSLVLARMAANALRSLPARFSEAVSPLLEDYKHVLGMLPKETDDHIIRSSFVQTAFYGLFSSWVLWHRDNIGGEFEWPDAHNTAQVPFISELLYELNHPSRIKELGIRRFLNNAADILRRVDTDSFFSKFPISPNDEVGPSIDAITYFYEPFLAAFDPTLRDELGVWYTPPEIVAYQVARVEAILKANFGCANGFADERVVVLDPACGTGAYLIEVLRRTATTLSRQGSESLIGLMLREMVLKRIIGFELLTAPFTVTHLQLRLLLEKYGVELDTGERPAVFLTNSLVGWGGGETLPLSFPGLAAERDAARQVKTEEQILVVLGNPPYNRFADVTVMEDETLADVYKGVTRNNKGKVIGTSLLFEKWKVRKQLLNDLYVRFIRIAERQIVRTGHGIVSYITNNSYLTGRSHPLMREVLLHNFDQVWIDNLHGNRIASERTPSGESCETVFNMRGLSAGIKVGTCIASWVRTQVHSDQPSATAVHYRDLWGKAVDKRNQLASDARDTTVAQEAYALVEVSENNRWRLCPRSTTKGYDDWISIDELFPVHVQGVNPNRGIDGSLVAMNTGELTKRMKEYFDPSVTWTELKQRHPELCKDRARYVAQDVRTALRTTSFDKERIVRYNLFPFDSRFLYYELANKLLNEKRPEMAELLGTTRFLVAAPMARRPSEARALESREAFDLHLHDIGAVGFPSCVAETDDFLRHGKPAQSWRANIHAPTLEAFSKRWNVPADPRSVHAIKFVGSLHAYVIGVTWTPEYLESCKLSLAQDYARIPVAADKKTFDAMAGIGEKIRSLLDMQVGDEELSTALLGPTRQALAVPTHKDGKPLKPNDLRLEISYFGSASGKWELNPDIKKDQLLGDYGNLWLNKNCYVSGVPLAVWEFEVGGYPAIKKWLGYRHHERRSGRPLSAGEVQTLKSIIRRIASLVLLGPMLNDVYSSVLQDALSAEDLGA